MKYVPSSDIAAHQKENSKHTREPWPLMDGTVAYIESKYSLDSASAILDIGCDNGRLLEHFAKDARTLYGVDLYDYVDSPIRDQITFDAVDLNFNALPHDDASLDVVCAFQVIEHLENPFFIMREVKRVLKPGGLFMYSIPNPFTLQSRIKFLISGNVNRWTAQNDHLLFLTPAVREKTYHTEFELCEVRHQKGVLPGLARLHALVGSTPPKSTYKVLPRWQLFAKSTCFVLRKPGQS